MGFWCSFHIYYLLAFQISLKLAFTRKRACAGREKKKPAEFPSDKIPHEKTLPSNLFNRVENILRRTSCSDQISLITWSDRILWVAFLQSNEKWSHKLLHCLRHRSATKYERGDSSYNPQAQQISLFNLVILIS